METKNANILIFNTHERAMDGAMDVQKVAFRKKHKALIINTHERAMDGQKAANKHNSTDVLVFSAKEGIEKVTDFAEKLSNQSIAPGLGGFKLSAPVISTQKNEIKRNTLTINGQLPSNGRAKSGQKSAKLAQKTGSENIEDTPKQERRPINVKKYAIAAFQFFPATKQKMILAQNNCSLPLSNIVSANAINKNKHKIYLSI